MKILQPPPRSAAENMEQDCLLLEKAEAAAHFYQWKNPSITYGHFFSPEEHFDLEQIEALGFDIAKRPTGGGALFHTHDFAFSFVVPVGHPLFSLNTMESYLLVNQFVAKGLAPLFSGDILPYQPDPSSKNAERFCMAHPTKYDLVVGQKKVGGAAQRRTKKAVLHQGTLSLLPPDRKSVTAVLKNGEELYGKMVENSFSMQGEIAVLRARVKDCLLQMLSL